MQPYAQEFCNYMDAHNIKYTVKKDNVIRVSYSGTNMDTIAIFVIFDVDNDPLVQLQCWEIQNFKTNEPAALVLCNELNKEYRWVKFYIDKDKDIIASLDAVIEKNTCGEECMQLVRRMVNIIDGAFPQIARARWAQ